MIVRGPGAVEAVLRSLSEKSALFGRLGIDHGADWIAVFAAALPGEEGAGEAVLPALDGVPLYADGTGWWLPVGVEIDAPAQAHDSLRTALGAYHGLRGSAIVVPRFVGDAPSTDAADLYGLGATVPLARLAA